MVVCCARAPCRQDVQLSQTRSQAAHSFGAADDEDLRSCCRLFQGPGKLVAVWVAVTSDCCCSVLVASDEHSSWSYSGGVIVTAATPSCTVPWAYGDLTSQAMLQRNTVALNVSMNSHNKGKSDKRHLNFQKPSCSQWDYTINFL